MAIDPNKAVSLFNSPLTEEAERLRITTDLALWLINDGPAPEESLDRDIIDDMMLSTHWRTAMVALRVNNLIELSRRLS